MNKFNLLVIVLAFFVFGQSFAQNFDQISATDPNTASFQKFIDFPVNPYNGTTDISIPVYHLKDGAVDIPIVLRYNTSGIKVAEEASWVGLGWNLDVGGSITHTIVGEEDNYQKFQTAQSNVNFQGNGDNYYLNYERQRLFDFSNSEEIISYLGSISYGSSTYDALAAEMGENQPDMYSFSFPEGSGQFIIDLYDDSNGYEGVVKLLNNIQNIKIERKREDLPPPASGFYYRWEITTENGILYNFHDKRGYAADLNSSKTVSRTYYLSDITYPNGDRVEFTYQSSGKGKNISSNSYTFYSSASQNLIQQPLNRAGNEYDNFYLEKIESANFTVDFVTSSRLDIKDGVKLDRIIVTDKSKGNQRKFIFNNSRYFENSEYPTSSYLAKEDWSAHITSDEMLRKRLKLESFGEENLPPYIFNYNSNGLPEKTSFAVDYWGYYNGEHSNVSLLPTIDQINFFETRFTTIGSSKTGTIELPSTLMYGGFNGTRAFNEEYADGWMLSSIENPLGGKTTYYFEPHTFSNFAYPTVQQIDEFTPGEPGDTPIEILTDDNCDYLPTSYQFNVNAPTKVKIKMSFHRGTSTTGDFQLMQDAYVRLGQYTTELHKWEIKSEYLNTEPYLYYEFDTILNPANSYGYNLTVILPDELGEQCGTCYGNPECMHLSVTASIYYAPVPDATVVNKSMGAGFRTQKIIQQSTTSSNTGIIIKQYVYEGESSSFGKLMTPLKFHQIYNFEVYTIGNVDNIYTDFAISSSSFIPTSSSALGALVGYSKVTIYEMGSPFQTIENASKGRTEMNFHNYENGISVGVAGNYGLDIIPRGIYYNLSPMYYYVTDLSNVPIVENYMNGKINVQIIYDKDDNILNTQSYTYMHSKNIDCVNGILAKNLNHSSSTLGPYFICFYPIRTGGFVLESETEINKLVSGDVTTTKTYNYNNFDQLSSVVSKSSKDLSVETTYKYPLDYNLLPLEENTDCEEDVKALSKMVQGNMIAHPVEVTKLIDGKLSGGSYTEYYNYTGDKVMPKKSYKVQNTKALDVSPMPVGTDFTPSFLSHDKKRIDKDNFYPSEADLELEYDSEGRIIQRTLKNNTPVSYLWGYNNTLPIAIVEGKTYGELETAISNAGLNINDLKITIRPSEGIAMGDEVLRTNINLIRDQLPGALITSYTYTPLYGVTSKTDPNRVVTYYIYDDFGRLLQIKDEDNKILKEYKYHYAKEE